MLLGGAGLGFAYTTLDILQDQALRLFAAPLSPSAEQQQALLDATLRMRTLLDLLVFSWGSSFALLGVGYYWKQYQNKKKSDRDLHLTQLITTVNKTPEWAQTLSHHIQTVNTEQNQSLQQQQAHLTTQSTTIQTMSDEIKKLTDQIAQLNLSTTSTNQIHNALLPLHTPFPTQHQPIHRPPSQPRLAISGPEILTDQEDEEFEPF